MSNWSLSKGTCTEVGHFCDEKMPDPCFLYYDQFSSKLHTPSDDVQIQCSISILVQGIEDYFVGFPRRNKQARPFRSRTSSLSTTEESIKVPKAAPTAKTRLTFSQISQQLQQAGVLDNEFPEFEAKAKFSVSDWFRFNVSSRDKEVKELTNQVAELWGDDEF